MFNILLALVLVASFVTPVFAQVEPPSFAAPCSTSAAKPVIFFAADGLRQDIVEDYATQGIACPRFGRLLRTGAKAADGGLLTQAPPNTGAGWYSLATGAWPGVHGSTNNTFHINGQPFTNRTAAFDPGVLQAETLAQAAERGGKKVAQIEWAGGRVRRDRRPHGRLPRASSPAAAWPPITSARMDDAAFVGFFRLAVRSSGRLCRAGALPGRRPTDATGWTNVPASYSPAKEMRLRVLDFGDGQVRSECLHLRLDQRQPRRTTTRCSSPHQGRRQRRRHPAPGQWGDVKVKIVGGALAGLTAGILVKVEELTTDLSPGAPVPHLRHPRQSPPGPPGPASPASAAILPSTSPRNSPPPPRPILPFWKPASSAKRPTSSRGCTGRPGIYPLHHATSSAATSPTWSWSATRPRMSSSTSSWVWSPPRCPTAPPIRPMTTCRSTARPTARVAAQQLPARAPTTAPTPPWRLVQIADAGQGHHLRLVRSRLCAAVPGHRRQQGAGRPGLALQAADLQLPPGDRRDHRQGQGLLGRRHGADLPQPGRPRSGWRRLPAGACHSGSRHGCPDQGRLPGPRPIPTTGPATASPKAGW